MISLGQKDSDEGCMVSLSIVLKLKAFKIFEGQGKLKVL